MADAPRPNHIRAWREFRDLTIEELADMLDCSKASVGHWETGAREVGAKWLYKIAEALHTPPGWLLDHDPNDLDTRVMDAWASIPTEDRPRALQVLQAFQRTGTGG